MLANVEEPAQNSRMQKWTMVVLLARVSELTLETAPVGLTYCELGDFSKLYYILLLEFSTGSKDCIECKGDLLRQVCSVLSWKKKMDDYIATPRTKPR